MLADAKLKAISNPEIIICIIQTSLAIARLMRIICWSQLGAISMITNSDKVGAAPRDIHTIMLVVGAEAMIYWPCQVMAWALLLKVSLPS